MTHNAMPSRRALYVSAFLPDESAPHAGGQAAFQHRLDLEHAGYEVTCMICTTEPVRQEHLTTPRTTVFGQTRSTALVGYLANLLAGKTTMFAAWPLLDTRANVAFERALRHELAKGEYELVFADFTQVIPPVIRALPLSGPRPHTRCCAHDLFIQKMMRSESASMRWLTGPVVRAERNLLRSFDEVITLSDKDQALATQLYDLPQVSVRPWTAPRWTGAVTRLPAGVHTSELLFFANFARPENAEAANWLLTQAWPTIRSAVPDATLVLGGAGSKEVTLPVGAEGIRRAGFLDNPGELFEHCELAIAPLAQGAGVKFKVLEALACGVTVVGTPVALEGIQRSALTVEASRDGFADTIISLLSHRQVSSATD
ncbi:MAG: glycosyltransferase family 4 protein [Acidovorax sp.]|jgi:glycosyltransferase involved in cell wall biosynthesis|nr:glycosyltransferase family 4 protein [Acidovorax sp.]